MKDCPFCNLQDRVLKSNDLANLFLSNPRKVSGHFLVTPKRHVELPWELTKAELAAIFELVFLLQKRITEKYSSGCDVRQNYRPFMKQGGIKVDHVHYHVYPRSVKDDLSKVEKQETEMFISLPDDEAAEMAEIIRGT